MTRVVVDTGPLVAFLNARDQHHAWTRQALDALDTPVYTCEPVLTEAFFLLRRVAGAHEALWKLLERGLLRSDFRLHAELDAVAALMRRYANVPIALADACLIRMSELDPDTMVLTLDGDFRVYRRNRRHVIPTIMPPRK